MSVYFGNGTLQQRCTIDGVEYTAGKLSKLCKVCKDTARLRIIKFNLNQLSLDELFFMGKLPRKKSAAVIDGVEYLAEDIARITGRSLGTCQNKLYQFCRGAITKEDLFRTEPIKGRPRAFKKNDSWPEMRAAKRVSFTPGSWEVEHIPDRRKGKRRRSSAGRPQGSQDTREQPAYSHGQFTFSFR